jgi:hypothetical protein
MYVFDSLLFGVCWVGKWNYISILGLKIEDVLVFERGLEGEKKTTRWEYGIEWA